MSRAAVERFDDALWARYGTTPDYVERIARVLELVPPDARLVLDVGCGRGEVVSALAASRAGLLAIATDPSPEALRYPTVPSVLAGLPQLPFGTRAFDTVICLQVLEHLDGAEYDPARLELQRVAARHLVIGVPYRENLATKRVRCAACGRASHVDGHLRTFDDASLRTLFDGAVLVRRVLAGVVQHRQSRVGVCLRRLSGNYAGEEFRCPYCGGREPSRPGRARAATGRATAPLSHALRWPRKPLPYWALALYRKSDV